MTREQKLKMIIATRNYDKMICLNRHPMPGKYYITGIQQGNDNPEKLIGYVVQVRKEAGAYGSHLVLMRHPNGDLIPHHNQSFFELDESLTENIKKFYPTGMDYDSHEDHSQPYTLGGGEFPETGPIVEPNTQQLGNGNPCVMITTEKPDGSQIIEMV